MNAPSKFEYDTPSTQNTTSESGSVDVSANSDEPRHLRRASRVLVSRRRSCCLYGYRQKIAAIVLLFCALLVVSGPVLARTLKIATLSPDGTAWMRELRQGGSHTRAAFC